MQSQTSVFFSLLIYTTTPIVQNVSYLTMTDQTSAPVLSLNGDGVHISTELHRSEHTQQQPVIRFDNKGVSFRVNTYMFYSSYNAVCSDVQNDLRRFFVASETDHLLQVTATKSQGVLVMKAKTGSYVPVTISSSGLLIGGNSLAGMSQNIKISTQTQSGWKLFKGEGFNQVVLSGKGVALLHDHREVDIRNLNLTGGDYFITNGRDIVFQDASLQYEMVNLGQSWWDKITTFGQDDFFLVKFTGGSGRVGIATRCTTLSEAHRAAKLSEKILHRLSKILHRLSSRSH